MTGAQEPPLIVDGVAASYVERGVTLPVLDGISLTLAHGEFVAIVGPSGSGKSTLLDLIAGLAEPDRGRIVVNGVEGRGRLGRSVYMHQRDLLLPWRTVVQNAALALEVRGVGRAAARAEARRRLPEFGLEGFGDVFPAALSGGMRQRAAFLRTVLAGAELLLLDEPFGALDALTRIAMQEWLMAMLAAAEPARTVLLVTHDVEEAVMLADRVLVLSERPARIRHVEPVPFPRPRPRAIVTSPSFVAHRAAILTALGIVDSAAVERAP